MNLQANVDQLIQKENLIDKTGDRILIAISGGRDSICLFHILYHLGYTLGLAHINHQLRGEEADLDEDFVRNLAVQFQIPFYSKSIDIKRLAKAKKENIHQYARTERYLFFNEICKNEGFTKVATAHHLDDQIESFIFHFSRGSGLRGLSGIPIKRDNIIRPLINSSRKEINEFIASKNIEFREDASNDKLDYSRNFIRHKIIPLLEEVHPGFYTNASHSLDILQQSRAFYEEQMDSYYSKLVRRDGKYFMLEQSAIYQEANGKIILYEILQKFNFNKDQLDQIYSTNEGNGQLFHSSSHSLLADRKNWIIRENQEYKEVKYTIPHSGIRIPDIGVFKIVELDVKPKDLSTKYTAYLDRDKVKFPLILRNWKPGDYFYPLNMNGKKQKLKNFFVNEKLSRFEKEEVLILESEGEIVWLIGHRMDNRFKIMESTTKFLSIQFESE